MIQYVITFFIVQVMFFIIAIFGGVEFGTEAAGALCAASQVVGVIVCYIESQYRRSSL